MSWVVEVNQLIKVYDGFKAVDGISLRIKEGEIFGFLGPNGAGKTTTILTLLGLTEPTSGEVKVFGYNPTKEPLKIRRLTGYLPENVGFYGELSARENLAYITRLNGIPAKKAFAKIEEVLSLVGLSGVANHVVSKFSRGMMQRLGIAATLVKEPKLVILDEPTLGIDPEGVEQILGLITRMKKEQNITVVLSSHLLHQVQRICDRVGIISGGRMVVEGSVDELGKKIMGEEKTQVEVQVSTLTPGLVKSLGKIEGVEGIKESGNVLRVKCKKDLRLEISRRIVENGALPISIRSQDYTLEEIYVRYFRE